MISPDTLGLFREVFEEGARCDCIFKTDGVDSLFTLPSHTFRSRIFSIVITPAHSFSHGPALPCVFQLFALSFGNEIYFKSRTVFTVKYSCDQLCSQVRVYFRPSRKHL